MTENTDIDTDAESSDEREIDAPLFGLPEMESFPDGRGGTTMIRPDSIYTHPLRTRSRGWRKWHANGCGRESLRYVENDRNETFSPKYEWDLKCRICGRRVEWDEVLFVSSEWFYSQFDEFETDPLSFDNAPLKSSEVLELGPNPSAEELREAYEVTFAEANEMGVIRIVDLEEEDEETTQEKGERNENKALDILGRVYGRGNVDRVQRFTNNDPLGLADLLAMREGYPTRLVQVKTNRFTADDRRRYLSRLRSFPSDAVFEVWVRVDYEGWRIYRHTPDSEDGFEEVIRMDSCSYEDTVEAFREDVGYYDNP